MKYLLTYLAFYSMAFILMLFLLVMTDKELKEGEGEKAMIVGAFLLSTPIYFIYLWVRFV